MGLGERIGALFGSHGNVDTVAEVHNAEKGKFIKMVDDEAEENSDAAEENVVGVAEGLNLDPEQLLVVKDLIAKKQFEELKQTLGEYGIPAETIEDAVTELERDEAVTNLAVE